MIKAIGEFFVELVAAAMDDAAMIRIINDGPAARFVAIDPATKVTMSMFVTRGDAVTVNRSWRLIVEPIDHVYLRSLERVSSEWVTS